MQDLLTTVVHGRPTSNGMKLLILSTDANLFRDESEVRARLVNYGSIAESVHIVVSVRPPSPRGEKIAATNVFSHPAVGRSKVGKFFSLYRTASRLLASGGTWIISAQDSFEVGLVGLFLKIRFGIPLELQVHTDFLSPYFTQESFLNQLRSFLATRLIPLADSVRVVSKRIQSSIEVRGLIVSEKISVLPVFIDPNFFEGIGRAKIFHAKQPFTILMPTRISREKNIGLAIAAIKKLVKEYPDIILKIIGEGPELQNIKHIVQANGLRERVIFKPWAKDLREEYGSADAVLITSNYEGYGRTAVEAMLAGVPVVMTDVGVSGDLVRDGETGKVVPIGDSEKLMRALKDLIENPKERELIRREARKSVAKLPDRAEYFKIAGAAFDRMKQKICYVFPKYHDEDSTHFAYQSEFVREITNHYDVRLIVEWGNAPKNLGTTASFSGDAGTKFGIIVQAILRILIARLAGYRTFYVHYSFRAAFIAKIVQGRVCYWNCGEPWKYRRNLFRETFERMTYHIIDTLVTGTEGLGRTYASHYQIPSSRISIMPNWIDTKNFQFPISNLQKVALKQKLRISPDQKIVLFVHRLSKRKGAHYIPEIISKLRNTKTTVIIVGEGPEKENLNLRFTIYNLQSRVRLVGAVPNRDLGAYYGIADALLVPSDEEGFPHVLLEAMAFGVPFVASDVGGVRDIVPSAMYASVVPAGNIDAFAEQLDRMLTMPTATRQNLRTILKEWVTRYNLDAAVAAFEQIVG
ncbi:MAG: glycosyltransferase family 4 protein [Patescibacteria group bacterium]